MAWEVCFFSLLKQALPARWDWNLLSQNESPGSHLSDTKERSLQVSGWGCHVLVLTWAPCAALGSAAASVAEPQPVTAEVNGLFSTDFCRNKTETWTSWNGLCMGELVIVKQHLHCIAFQLAHMPQISYFELFLNCHIARICHLLWIFNAVWHFGQFWKIPKDKSCLSEILYCGWAKEQLHGVHTANNDHLVFPNPTCKIKV